MPVQLKTEEIEGFWNWTADTFLIHAAREHGNLATALGKEALIPISARVKEQ